MDASLATLKETLFDLLEGAYSTPDVQAVQQMGVQMTNAVREKGVVIIQNQNVEVYARMIPALVKCVKLCDSMEHGRSFAPAVDCEVLELPEPAVEVDALEAFCAWLYENRTPWKKMQKLVKAAYLSYVLKKLPVGVEAARLLGVGPSYLSAARFKAIIKEQPQQPDKEAT